MKICQVCNSENNDNADKCINCGNVFYNPNVDQNSQPDLNSQSEIVQQDVNLSQNYQEINPQNIPNNNEGFNQQNIPPNTQMNQNQYQQYQSNTPQNQKSKIVGIILNMLLVGLGYAYVGKWGEGIVLLVLYIIMFTLGFLLLFPFVIALALWIYSLFKTNEMIDKYNQGLPY